MIVTKVKVLTEASVNRIVSPALNAVVHPVRVVLSYLMPAEIAGGVPPVISPPMTGG